MQTQRRELSLEGGGALALRVYEPSGEAQATVVIGGAMGVPQDYYAAYAAWLATQGYRVFTFDYRGHGESLPHTRGNTLRGYRADLFDWALDYEAVVRRAKQERPQQPLYLVGHSLGAQLPGLCYPEAGCIIDTGKFDKIRVFNKIDGHVALITIVLLDLADHAQRVVVQNDNLDIQTLFHSGAEFLHTHLETPVSGNQDDFPLRCPYFSPNRGRQAISHSPQPT